MESAFQCDTCKKVLKTSAALKRHIKNVCGKTSICKCADCGKTFGCQEYLDHHERSMHNKIILKRNFKLICSEDECGDRFSNMKVFRNHLKESHGKDTKKSTHKFSSLEDFNIWKDGIEAKTGIMYSKNTGRATGGKIIFHCRRSGAYKPRGTGKRHLKKQGSCKIGSYCSSTIELCITDGIYMVTHYEDHYGHTLNTKDLAHTLLPQSTKHFIVDKLANNVPTKDIRDMVRESRTDDRSRFIKRQDIVNIEKTLDFNSLECLHPEQIKETQEPHINKIKSQRVKIEPSEKKDEIPAILDDLEAERKRQKASMAKQKREKQKNRLAELEAQVANLTRDREKLEAQVATLTCEREELGAQVTTLTHERKELKASSEKYRRKSQVFEEKFKKVCCQFGVPIVIVTN